jgi:toxin ParE1/3/4
MGPARPHILPYLRILPLHKRAVAAYRIMADRVEVLRIFYGGQDYETILGEADS